MVPAVRRIDPTETTDWLQYVVPNALNQLMCHSSSGPVSVEFQMGEMIVETLSICELDVVQTDD